MFSLFCVLFYECVVYSSVTCKSIYGNLKNAFQIFFVFCLIYLACLLPLVTQFDWSWRQDIIFFKFFFWKKKIFSKNFDFSIFLHYWLFCMSTCSIPIKKKSIKRPTFSPTLPFQYKKNQILYENFQRSSKNKIKSSIPFKRNFQSLKF